MNDKLKFPPANAFYIEDPEEPGKMGIPVIMLNGEKIMLMNIREERQDFFRAIVADLAHDLGVKACFVTYDSPSNIEEIDLVKDGKISNIIISTKSPPKASDFIEKLVNVIDEILVKRHGSQKENKNNEETRH